MTKRLPQKTKKAKRPFSTDEIGKGLREALNREGYPFHQAITACITGKSAEFHLSWTPLVLEFPVQAQNRDTRIDLILVNKSKTIYLVCECKRANPALARWGFARSSHIAERFQYPRIDRLSRNPNGQIRASVKHLTRGEPLPFHIAVELSTGQKGDTNGKRRGEIEEAATQVSRGLNGLINSFSERGFPRLGCDGLYFLPVVITTAELWGTDLALDEASLADGQIVRGRIEVKKYDWLWYDYPQSSGLKHAVPDDSTSTDLDQLLYDRFARTIAIVTPDGLDDFLGSPWWSRLLVDSK